MNENLTVLVRRLAGLMSLQIDAFEELHADFIFDAERVKTLQLMVRTLGMFSVLDKQMVKDGHDGTFSAGDIVEFRHQLAQRINALGSVEKSVSLDRGA